MALHSTIDERLKYIRQLQKDSPEEYKIQSNKKISLIKRYNGPLWDMKKINNDEVFYICNICGYRFGSIDSVNPVVTFQVKDHKDKHEEICKSGVYSYS